jgi:hypothetical protein
MGRVPKNLRGIILKLGQGYKNAAFEFFHWKNIFLGASLYQK